MSSSKRAAIILLELVGTLFIAIGALLWFNLLPYTPVYAADEPEYIGARECGSCHRDVKRIHDETKHTLTLQEDNSETIPGDFTQGSDIRAVQFPGEDKPRPFELDDISFSVGSGRYIQRYLYELDKNEYVVFPAEWNVVEQMWQPYQLAETWPDAAYDWTTNCAGCHVTGLNTERGRWEDDGVQCEACHGPGSVHAELADDASRNVTDEELTAIRAAIVASPDPQICGSCHSQGTGENSLPYPAGYLPGQNLLANYNLVAPTDTAHWRESGHGKSQNMQFNEWIISGHAIALESVKASDYAEDSCLECHSADFRWAERLVAVSEAGEREGTPPELVTLETAKFGVTCSSCHVTHSKTPLESSLTSDTYTLCTSCHGDGDRIEQVHHPVQEMYEGQTVVENIPGIASKHFNQNVECVTCHMPQTLQTGSTWYAGSHTMTIALPGLVEEGQPDSCTGCHNDLDQDYMQQFLDQTQNSVVERLNAAENALETASDIPAWIPVVLDFVSKDGSFGVHNFSYASTLLDKAELALGVVQDNTPSSLEALPVSDPTQCAECHADEYRQWQLSPHANASLSDTFAQVYAESGRPSYCMRCHASGYDAQTEEYVFEGVVCSNCHFDTGNTPHPPGPIEVADDAQICGRCHSGEHAPTYDEWLVSAHNAAQIDCVDCHTPHNNGLILNDVNATCGSCHENALVDEIHMGAEMTCVECHMSRRTAPNGVQVIQTGHSMSIDPGICADCHGQIHLLSFGDTKLSDQEKAELESLKNELLAMEGQATQNLNSGIVGGAIGALALVIILFFVVRLGRTK
jgi:predicted CXXCH cytochrome family protein